MTTEPQTAAGRALLQREDLNSRSFALITADAILAIEREARSGLDAGLREAVQFTAIPTLLIFAEDNAGVRNAIEVLRAALARRVRVTTTERERFVDRDR